MYILNSNKLKNRPVWITWLFFNRRLQRDIKESIPILTEDISRLDDAEKKVHAANLLSLELSIFELKQRMIQLLANIRTIQTGWVPYHEVLYIVNKLDILDDTLKEVEFKKELSDV